MMGIRGKERRGKTYSSLSTSTPPSSSASSILKTSASAPLSGSIFTLADFFAKRWDSSSSDSTLVAGSGALRLRGLLVLEAVVVVEVGLVLLLGVPFGVVAGVEVDVDAGALPEEWSRFRPAYFCLGIGWRGQYGIVLRKLRMSGLELRVCRQFVT